METIEQLKKKADKLCGKRGHKLKWKYDRLVDGKAWMGYCEKCWSYARINPKPERWWRPFCGTIFKDFSSDVKRVCSGAKIEANYKREYAWKRKSILKAYKEGGIEKAIIAAIGKGSIKF